MMQSTHVGFDSIIRAATAERSATGVANMYAISAFEQLGLSACSRARSASAASITSAHPKERLTSNHRGTINSFKHRFRRVLK